MSEITLSYSDQYRQALLLHCKESGSTAKAGEVSSRVNVHTVPLKCNIALTCFRRKHLLTLELKRRGTIFASKYSPCYKLGEC